MSNEKEGTIPNEGSPIEPTGVPDIEAKLSIPEKPINPPTVESSPVEVEPTAVDNPAVESAETVESPEPISATEHASVESTPEKDTDFKPEGHGRLFDPPVVPVKNNIKLWSNILIALIGVVLILGTWLTLSIIQKENDNLEKIKEAVEHSIVFGANPPIVYDISKGEMILGANPNSQGLITLKCDIKYSELDTTIAHVFCGGAQAILDVRL